jgi:protoheme ferro-lyase
MKMVLGAPSGLGEAGELWLGNIAAARNVELLQANHISHVLSVINIAEIAEMIVLYSEIGIEHKIINIEDDSEENILKHLLPAIDFIEQGIFCNVTLTRT